VSFLQNLFSRPVQSGHATHVLPESVSSDGTMAAPAVRPVINGSNGSPHEPRPTPATEIRAPEPATSAIRPEDCVCFPLKAITDLFPLDLKAVLRKQPSENVHVHIPRDIIRPKLAAGVVRIPFAQLRAATPEIFFHAQGALDNVKVVLPLEIILRQVAPPRREDQRQPAIPVSIPSVFLKARQAGASGVPAPKPKEAWYSQRRPTYEMPEEEEEPERDAQDAQAGAKNGTPSNGKPDQSFASVTHRSRRINEPREAYSIPIAWNAAPESSDYPDCPDYFTLPLASVLGALPAKIRHALNGSDAQTASFLIPLAEFEPRLRAGKLLFKWAQMRDWCSVPLHSPVAPDSDIELPIEAVVPLFFAAGTARVPRKQVEVDTRIPDVFSKSKFSSRVHPPNTAPTLTPAEAEPEPAVPSPAPVRATPSPEPSRPAHTATVPAQVIDYLRKLDGVIGAFIATADGLLVAGDAPDANENVLAAFAPTVFAQLTKYADMAQLGAPESIDINLADGSTVHVRKAGNLYLGVLVPRDRPLPLRDLTRLSIALQPHTS